jgi:tetratricopeptide (TPR) repeat protein
MTPGAGGGTFAVLVPATDPPRLHERGRELAALDAALDAAAAGHGRVLVLEGPAGIGKTALLGAARAGARERGLAVASAQASELERRHAWGIVRQLLEPRLRGMAPAARDALLEGAPALAAPLVWPAAAPAAGRATGDEFGLLHGLFWLVAALAARRPLVLAVDDLQWADAASSRFLAFLAARIAGEPALLLAARRPGPPDGALHAAAGADVLQPASMSVPAAAELVRRPGGAPVTGAFADACHAATGGNPLLLERLAAGLRERGIDGTAQDDARAVAADGPYAVAGAVTTVLARLGDGPRRLAQAAAVLGPAPLRTVARLAAPDGTDPAAAGDGAAGAEAAADALVHAGLLSDARPLAFVHALVRDAVLEGLGAGERARLHRRAADLLTRDGAAPDAVAVHLLETEPAGDPAVAGALAAAGRRALASGAVSEAAAALERALIEPAPADDRCALLLDLARAEHALGRETAPRRALAAHAAAASPQERAHAAITLFRVAGPATLEPDEAFELIEAAAAGLGGSGGDGAADRDLVLRLKAMRFLTGFLDPALMRRVLAEPEPPGFPGCRTPAECAALLQVGARRFLLGGSAAAVTEAVERAVAAPELLLEAAADSYWLELAISALFKADRLEAARRTVEAALSHAQRRGSAPGFASASAWRAWIALRAGDAAAAEADARAAQDAVPPDAWQRVWCTCALIDVLVERGDLDAAQAALARGSRGRPRAAAPRGSSASGSTSRPATRRSRRSR